jgi:oligopeptide transport system ATP-binding protein
MSDALLEVRKLKVCFGGFTALEDVTFHLDPGETLGLVGESGSGKSTLARAIMRLIPAAGGELIWSGENMLAWPVGELRRRRRDMQIIFQDPLASLNPRLRVGEIIAEPLEIFLGQLSARERRQRVGEMLERVGLSADMAARYPHEFSGGQCQRIGIARAMILRPRLLICDEPVSSLDVSIQGQIVNLLADLQSQWGTALLFISHNLAVVRHLCHRVLVIYRGRLIEIAPRDALFAAPRHPYTQALLAAVPDPARGFVPALAPLVAGATAEQARHATPACAYQARCGHALGPCLTTVPPLQAVDPQHDVACHRWREVVYS